MQQLAGGEQDALEGGARDEEDQGRRLATDRPPTSEAVQSRCDGSLNFSDLKWNNMKMLTVFYLLLILTVGRCSDDLNFDMKTVGVGDDVNLTCARQKSSGQGTLFWIRLVSGNFLKFLGGTYSFDYIGVNKTPHMTTKQEPGTFLLQIHETRLSDTGLYYCIKIKQLEMTFLNGTFLRIKGPEPNITAVIQVPPSDPVRPGDSVTLQSLVLSDSENKTCPGEHAFNRQEPVLFLLCAALALSLIVIAFLIYNIKNKSGGFCNAAAALETNAATASDQQIQQRDEDHLTYAAPTFTKRKAGKAERRNIKTEEEETIYSGVRTFGTD
ncbi:uncharacterized protein LOC109140768 [Larimichthys crocea]|uniref:uncharacterized protein LOC109140768 n=1 Tax=Larimichthys crocea TaxID=215358 RepID=UPI000F5ED70C|nr:uncharacterized protein LOC109140768 [Larimichthys crocea]